MRPTKSQLAARTAIVRLTSSGLPPTALAEQIAAALTQALPNDGFRVFGVDPTTLLVNRLLAASESDGWARREWLRDVYLAADQLPYIELPRLMGLRLPVVASQPRQSECWGYPADILAQLRQQADRLSRRSLLSQSRRDSAACRARSRRHDQAVSRRVVGGDS